jgi:DNA-binding transcriptional ArsR family regulator
MGLSPTSNKALADPMRLRIMNLLLRPPFCVCEMERGLKLSRLPLSRHLACLRNCRLVESQREGMRVNYNLNEKQPFLKQIRPLLLDALANRAVGRADLRTMKIAVWKRKEQNR